MKIRIEKAAEEMKQGLGNPESLQDLGSKVMEINNEVRRIMADLRPSILDDLGIIAAMNWFCGNTKRPILIFLWKSRSGYRKTKCPIL